MSVTTFVANKLMDYSFGAVAYSQPATYYMGLSTTTITNAGGNVTEPVGSNYARIAVVNNKTLFNYSTSGCVLNVSDLSFPQSGSVAWGTITDVALFDALTSGSVWYYTPLAVPRIVQTLSTITFSASAIVLSMTN
jgi:hypothetical protein